MRRSATIIQALAAVAVIVLTDLPAGADEALVALVVGAGVALWPAEQSTAEGGEAASADSPPHQTYVRSFPTEGDRRSLVGGSSAAGHMTADGGGTADVPTARQGATVAHRDGPTG